MRLYDYAASGNCYKVRLLLALMPGFVADLEPYGENARPGAGRSIYG